MNAKNALAVILCCLLSIRMFADVWQDPETKVNYGYELGSGEAKVLKSGDVEGDISILSRFTIDNTEYVVKSMDQYAFESNKSLHSISIPGTIKVVAFNSFQHCSNLSSVILHEGTDAIGDYAFYNTTSLRKVVLPSSIRLICYHAFSGSALDSIAIPDGIEWLGRYTFKGCKNLKKVVLPALSTFPTDWSGYGYCRNFESCTALEEVVCRSLIPPTILENPFWGVDLSRVTLYVPMGTKEQYLSSARWNTFKEIVEIDINYGPTLLSTIPENKATDVPVSGSIVLNFDKAVTISPKRVSASWVVEDQNLENAFHVEGRIMFFDDNNISLEFGSGESNYLPKFFIVSQAIRMYAGHTLKINGNGKTIVGVRIYFRDQYTGTLNANPVDNLVFNSDNWTWTGRASEILFTNDVNSPSQLRTYKIEIEYEDDIKGNLNGMELSPLVNNNLVEFKYSGIDYKKNYTFTFPGNSITDLVGNKVSEDITLTFTTSEHPINALLPFGQFSREPWYAKKHAESSRRLVSI